MKDGTSRLVSSSGYGMVIDGGLHGAYDRSLYQGGRVMASELVMAMDTQVTVNTSVAIGLHDGMDDVIHNQDAQICSFFAHANELAFGSEQPSLALVPSVSSFPRTESFSSTMSVINNEASDGN